MEATRNFEQLRKMLLMVREQGNKRSLSKKMFAENDCNELVFTTFEKDCEKLYQAIDKYIRVQNNNEITDDKVLSKTLSGLNSKMFDQWKLMLDYVNFGQEMRVKQSDINTLIGFARELTTDGLESDSKKSMSVGARNAFRKKVEILLGIKLEGATVMTAERKEWITNARKLSKAVNKLKERMAEIEQAVSNERDAIIGQTSQDVIDHLNTRIANMNEEWNNMSVNLKSLEAELATIKLNEVK